MLLPSQIQQNISLKPYNTFGIDATAKYFGAFSSMGELETVLDGNDHTKNILILGGGSNILFTKNFEGLVLKNDIKGIEELHEDNEAVYVRCGAGENWHGFVEYAINKGWNGLENLSLIPGNVGASPMQNIGAYGVEMEDYFWSLEAFHLKERKLYTFTKADCEFGYRESVFKKRLKNALVILNVTFRLPKTATYHTSYGAILEELDKMGITVLSTKAISQAVINIRRSKLPDPKEIGNAGSFFKNPSVSADQHLRLKNEFPNIVSYKNIDESFKLAAGWMIEQCGWKGFRSGDAGCHARQALVLVNYGNATGSEIFSLSTQIIASVKERFKVELEREVNII